MQSEILHNQMVCILPWRGQLKSAEKWLEYKEFDSRLRFVFGCFNECDLNESYSVVDESTYC